MRMRSAALVALLLVGGWSCSRDPKVASRKYLESGNRYFDKGKYKEAVIMYRNALRKDLMFGEAYYRLGVAELRMGQTYWVDAVRNLRRAVETLEKANQPQLLKDARGNLADLLLLFYLGDSRRHATLRPEIEALASKLLEREPNSVEGLRLKGYLSLRGDNNPKEAITHLRRAHEAVPFRPQVVFPLVQALLLDHQTAEAEALGRELIQREKTFGPMYDLLFEYYSRSNRTAEAEGVLKLKVANNPKEARPRIQLAAYYAATNHREEMRAVLQQLISNTQDFPNAYRQVGEFYAGLRDFDTAQRMFEQGAKANPKEAATFRVRTAELLVAQGKRADAMRILDQVLKEKPKDDSAKAMRASLMIDPAHPEQLGTAISELQALVSRMPKNAVLRFNLAGALTAKGETAQARVQLQEAVKINPSYLPPRQALVHMHLAKGEFAQAIQGAKEILELYPNHVAARLLQAQAYLGTGNSAQARQEIETVLRQNPNLPEAHLQLALLHTQQREFKEAEQILARLYRTNPTDPRGLMGLTDVYALQNQFDKGIELLNTELAKQPERLDLVIAIANLEVRSGRYEQAIANYSKVLQKNPSSTDLHLQIGETHRRKGDPASAAQFFRKAIQLSPSDPRAYLPLGILQDSLGQRAEAKATYQHVLKLQPDQPVALNNLAFLMAESGEDLDQALALAQRAKQLLPQDPNVADTLGWIYIKKNLSDNAVEIFRDLVGKLPQNTTYRYHLGMALYQKGDKLSARKELQTALQSKPAPEEAAKIRELLAKLG